MWYLIAGGMFVILWRVGIIQAMFLNILTWGFIGLVLMWITGLGPFK